MPNRLVDSSSPYLRQHKDNPVDWYPWCDAAFALAKSQDKPIFLSVGYSACHWCHVMERESFEDEQIAAVLNAHFVAIKVDREERPDVDQIYMQAVQMLTGSGGWPMSVFMTADAVPFFGGTYWPPDSRWGRPGFGQVLLAVADAWKNKRAEIQQQGQQITGHLQAACRGPEVSSSGLDPSWLDEANQWLLGQHDAVHGGFGNAPKFPHATDLLLLIELDSLKPDPVRGDAIQLTLDKMARGGIYDHLGGGFARYSVDDKWLVPHFEKMLYDNALLASAYAAAYRLWQREEDAIVVRQTLDYIIRDMTNPDGGYLSTEDADSEGVEGKFYVWSRDEILEVLASERGESFCTCYGVTAAGNFEGANILNLPVPIAQFAELHGLDRAELRKGLDADRQKLLAVRQSRVRPGLDDKVLLSWNALMIVAMVDGYRAVGDPRYLQSAERAVGFATQHMRQAEGRWFHTWREGLPSLDAYLDDMSYLLVALTDLFQVNSSHETLELAIEVADAILGDFSDPEGGFFFTGQTHETLIARSKDLADSSVPSANAMAASGLLTLGRLTGSSTFSQAANRALVAASGVMAKSPAAAGQSLRTLLHQGQPPQELVLLLGNDVDGEEANTARSQLLQAYLPHTLTIVVAGEQATDRLQEICPLTKHRTLVDNLITLYVCEHGTCSVPIRGPDALKAFFEK